jgi:hypothetical protein
MGRWADGQMDRWTDGRWADGQMGRWTDGQMGDGQMDRWTDGQMDKWTDRHTDGTLVMIIFSITTLSTKRLSKVTVCTLRIKNTTQNITQYGFNQQNNRQTE